MITADQPHIAGAHCPGKALHTGTKTAPNAVSRRCLLGVFLVAGSLLLLEITLTRIFSVVLWYHLAVVSISLALLGTAAGGVFVYVFGEAIGRRRLARLLQYSALAYSVSIPITYLVFIGIPILPAASFAGLMNLGLVYFDLAIPFFLGGLCLALAIARLSHAISRVYFADLLGASAGCLLAIPALDLLGAPGAVMLTAVLGAAGSFAFAPLGRGERATRLYVGWAACLLALIVLNSACDMFHLEYIKGGMRVAPRYERWNSYSRVAVSGEWHAPRPFGWGISDQYTGGNPGSMHIDIDGTAGTPITRFDGDFGPVDFLKYDVSNIVYYLKSNSHVLVVGPGGGRDILSALLFGQGQIDGVELNPVIVDAVRGPFGEYSGHLYDHPRVRMFVDDGRNYIVNSGQSYDVIQLSAVDTWAATAAGALALSENVLYTQEAFRAYRDHLTPDGILAVSRFILPHDNYGEALRLTGLALSAWETPSGDAPASHLIAVAKLNATRDDGYVTVLMKRSPFTADERQQLRAVSESMGFEVLYSPFGDGQGILRDFVAGGDFERFWQAYPVDVSPPTDDRPFFFQMLRLGDVFAPRADEAPPPDPVRMLPVIILAGFLIIIGEMTLAFIFVPLWFVRRDVLRVPNTRRFILYFCAIGVGFMMVEIGVMQKFVLVLGHPTYALATVLFVLLLSSGLGSYLTARVPTDRAARAGAVAGALVLGAVALYTIFLPNLQGGLVGTPRLLRVLVTVAALAPLGLVMGMLCPLGIKVVAAEAPALVPWCWAVNGATSVFASILALAVALAFGISGTLWLGWGAYVAALTVCVSLVVRGRQLARSSAPPPIAARPSASA